MNDLTPPRDHNKPPLSIEVRDRHRDVFTALDELAAAIALVPERIENDDDEGKAQDVVMKCKKTLATATAMHKLEKAPFDEKIKELKATFQIPMDKVDAVAKEVLKRLDDYKAKKAAEERRKREAEAQRMKEEAERKQREAEEAERQRQEAERLRREEEEKARRAQEARERAEREAREARERAERARLESIRLEQERKEREKREAQERAARAEQDAAEEARRKEEREAHEKRMTELKAEREAAEKKAAEEREKAKAALEERRKAEEAAAAAKKDERQAARAVDANLDDAARDERKAQKLDAAAQVSEADLSRGRGDYGSVGSRATFWTWRMIDRDKIPLEQLRPYINPDAIDAAVTKFMNAHRPELGKGRDHDMLLPGVEFYRDTTTRVA